MNKGSKYYALYEYFRQLGRDEITLTFGEIEQIVGKKLPDSAYKQKAWWSNRRKGAVQAASWMEAGYHAIDIDFEAQKVVFRKPTAVYNIQRDGDTVLWNGELVKALRYHMGLSQAELAEELGVRQQTISEWETGAYLPKRSTSKYLSLVAERAGFTYGEEES